MPPVRRELLDWNPDDAETEPIRVEVYAAPCACGRMLADCYTIEGPSGELVVSGMCPTCGPRTGSYLPPYAPPQSKQEALMWALRGVVVDLCSVHGMSKQEVLEATVAWCAEEEARSAPPQEIRSIAPPVSNRRCEKCNASLSNSRHRYCEECRVVVKRARWRAKYHKRRVARVA